MILFFWILVDFWLLKTLKRIKNTQGILCCHVHLNGQNSKKSILEIILPHLISRFHLVAFFWTSSFLLFRDLPVFFFLFFRLSILCCSQIGDDPIGRFSQNWRQAKYEIFFLINFLFLLMATMYRRDLVIFLEFFLNYEYWESQKVHDFSTFDFFIITFGYFYSEAAKIKAEILDWF